MTTPANNNQLRTPIADKCAEYRALLADGISVATGIHNYPSPGNETWVVHLVCAAIFANCLKLAKSIQILLDSGQYEAAHILCRPLSEQYISFRYIETSDSLNRARRYAARGTAKRESFRRMCLRIPDMQNAFSAELLASIETEFGHLEDVFGADVAKELRKHSSWAGITFEEMARSIDANALVTYGIGYSFASDTTHSSNLEDHIGSTDDSIESIYIKLYGSDHKLFWASKTACLTFGCLLDRINRMFGCKIDDYLLDYQARLKNVRG